MYKEPKGAITEFFWNIFLCLMFVFHGSMYEIFFRFLNVLERVGKNTFSTYFTLCKSGFYYIYLWFFPSEQCHNLISSTYKTSCKTGEGVEEMFRDIANQLVDANRSRLELQSMDTHGFKVTTQDEPTDPSCLC